MFYIVAEFNTDDNNKWVYDACERSGDPLPMVAYGPFETEDEANAYCEDFMPDDTDVYDVWVTSQLEEGWYANDPTEYDHYGYKLLAQGPLIGLIIRGENIHYNEKKLVA